MLAGRRIAVVGLSDDPSRASYGVAAYLRSAGKEILPVNPNYATVMGLKCYARLEDVPGEIDVVDVFRRPEHCPDVVRSAVAVGAKGVWLQSGVVSEESRRHCRAGRDRLRAGPVPEGGPDVPGRREMNAQPSSVVAV